MKFVELNELNGRSIWINPHHVISVFRGADNSVNVKVSDGKVYVVTQSLAYVVVELEKCS